MGPEGQEEQKAEEVALGLRERDRALLWHPATHFQDLEQLPPLPVTRAQGAWLELESGERVLDAISSWWTCLHGHCHPAIVEAVREQVGTLDHVMFAGFTHEPAVVLAEELQRRAPGDYARAFYADCGSAAIEVAMKLSYQYRKQTGQERRTKFATLQNSYHGETMGALGVSASDAYRELFAPLLPPDVTALPAPGYEHHDVGDVSGELGADSPEADALVEQLERRASELTAVLVEPLIQCAGRMTMPGVGFYRRLVQAAQALDIHVIADEIAVGFGRTGRLFASEHAGVSPDFLCLSKGLSGGVLPLSVVLIRPGIEDAFRGHPARSFLHSHTFTGNPLTCAAGLASLSVFDEEKTLERLQSKIEGMAALRRQVAQRCGQLVRAHRQLGFVAALEVDARRCERPSLELRRAALERGVLLRPLNDTVYWMPPYCVEGAELERLADVTAEVITTVLS